MWRGGEVACNRREGRGACSFCVALSKAGYMRVQTYITLSFSFHHFEYCGYLKCCLDIYKPQVKKTFVIQIASRQLSPTPVNHHILCKSQMATANQSFTLSESFLYLLSRQQLKYETTFKITHLKGTNLFWFFCTASLFTHADDLSPKFLVQM